MAGRNRWSGVALAMRHRLSGIHVQAQWPKYEHFGYPFLQGMASSNIRRQNWTKFPVTANDLECLQSAIFGPVYRADVVVLDDVDVFRRQVLVQMVLDAVDVSHVADAVRHPGHGRRHHAEIHLLLQPCSHANTASARPAV